MKDKLTIKAKRQGYKARSIYKLLELNKKYKLIKKNDRVLDLGCWPGSWLQASLKFTDNVIGVDLRETKINNAKTYKLDIFSNDIFKLGKFNVILSDLAPTTTGNIHIDQLKSYELSNRAFKIANKLLKKNGNFLVKIFQSEYSNDLLIKMKKKFKLAKSTKPTASKKKSKEVYFIGINSKNYKLQFKKIIIQ